jgi:DNA gyrase subunit A
MTLGQLVNLEQEKLQGEHAELLAEIGEYLRVLADETNILRIIRADLELIRDKHGDARRTEINEQESGAIDLEDLIEEGMMVVSISQRGYIKRTPTSIYRAQRRGGKGLKGATVEDEDPIEHLFVASTHDYLLFFTNKGKVYWQKVYELPELRRESKGRAIVNLLSLSEGESIAACLPVRDFEQANHYLVMGTRKGMVKKTPLQQYGRPKKTGIIAMNIKEDDELVAVAIVGPHDEIVQSTAKGQTSRFKQSTVRSSGRNAQGVNGIKLKKDDFVVGMVIADPEGTLLTLCQNGYGKRTPFGPNSPIVEGEEAEAEAPEGEVVEEEIVEAPEEAEALPEGEEPTDSGSFRYPTKGRRTGGVKDIVTTNRNGPVVATAAVRDEDELLIMTARGKLQRLRAADISIKGRRTQGVRIMSLDEGDTVIAVRTVPAEAKGPDDEVSLPVTPPEPPPPAAT